MDKQYIFGPVPSRRLGKSLGVDIVPYKTCSLNCAYCESGETTLLTSKRKEYIPVKDVIKQLDEALKKKPELDYITFSGGGEPTLNSGIGRVVSHIKKNYPQYKVCILTNGTFLGCDDLIEDLKELDLIVPSMDSSSEEEFQKINQPAEGMSFEGLLEGLVKFRKMNPQVEYWLEIFIVPKVNDTEESSKRFAKYVKMIKPDKVQLNTLDRPAWTDWMMSADENTVNNFTHNLEPFAPVQSVGRFSQKAVAVCDERTDFDIRIVELVRRRPCTLEDICFALSIDEQTASVHLKALEEKGSVKAEKGERGTFYNCRD